MRRTSFCVYLKFMAWNSSRISKALKGIFDFSCLFMFVPQLVETILRGKASFGKCFSLYMSTQAPTNFMNLAIFYKTNSHNFQVWTWEFNRYFIWREQLPFEFKGSWFEAFPFTQIFRQIFESMFCLGFKFPFWPYSAGIVSALHISCSIIVWDFSSCFYLHLKGICWSGSSPLPPHYCGTLS